jgi:hypothetical protein
VPSAIRFAVGQPAGRQSATWKIWSTKDDTYAACRAIGGYFKTSLHQSGSNRHALTEPAARQLLPPGADRKLDEWHNPRKRDQDVRLLLHIVIPEAELEPARTAPTKASSTHWREAPPPGWVTNIWVVHEDAGVGLETHPEVLGRPTDSVAHWHLRGGAAI